MAQAGICSPDSPLRKCSPTAAAPSRSSSRPRRWTNRLSGPWRAWKSSRSRRSDWSRVNSARSCAVSGNRIARPNNGSKRDRRKPCWRWAGSPAPRRFWPATASAPRPFFTRLMPSPAAPIAGSPRSWMQLSSGFPRRRGDCTVTRSRRPAHPCAGNSVRWTRRRVGLTLVSMLSGRCCW